MSGRGSPRVTVSLTLNDVRGRTEAVLHHQPCCVILQIAALVIDRVSMLERLQKLDFLQDILPFLEQTRYATEKESKNVYICKTTDKQRDQITSADCLPVKDIFLIATTSLVATLRACAGRRVECQCQLSTPLLCCVLT